MPLRVVRRKRVNASQRAKNRRSYRKRKSAMRRYARRYRRKASTKRRMKRISAFRKRRHIRRGQRLRFTSTGFAANIMESKMNESLQSELSGMTYGMKEMFLAYLEAALWSSMDNADESGGEPLDTNYDFSDIDDETLKQMKKDCLKFREEMPELEDDGSEFLPDKFFEQLGHDFWLTRNRHGAGFWDGDWSKEDGKKLTDLAHKFGEFDLYIGDDGKIHGSGGSFKESVSEAAMIDVQKKKFKTTLENFLNRKLGKDEYFLTDEGDHFKLRLGDIVAPDVNGQQGALERFLDYLSEFLWDLKTKQTYTEIHPNWGSTQDGATYVIYLKEEDAENEIYSHLRESKMADKKVSDFQLIDHGMENSSYFQGHGISRTAWDDTATGVGSTAHEAVEDALEQIAQNGWMVSDEMEKEAAKYPNDSYVGVKATISGIISGGAVTVQSTDGSAVLVGKSYRRGKEQNNMQGSDLEIGDKDFEFTYIGVSSRDDIFESFKTAFEDKGMIIAEAVLDKLYKDLFWADESEHYYYVSVDVKGEVSESVQSIGRKNKNAMKESVMSKDVVKLQESINEFKVALEKKVDFRFSEAFKTAARTAAKLEECYSSIKVEAPKVEKAQINEWDLSHLPDYNHNPKTDLSLDESFEELLGIKKPVMIESASVSSEHTPDVNAAIVAADLKALREHALKLADLADKGHIDESEAKDFLKKSHAYLQEATAIISEADDDEISDEDVAQYLEQWRESDGFSDFNLALDRGLILWAANLIKSGGALDPKHSNNPKMETHILKMLKDAGEKAIDAEREDVLKDVEIWIGKHNEHYFIPRGDVDYFMSQSDMKRMGAKFDVGYDEDGKEFTKSELDESVAFVKRSILNETGEADQDYNKEDYDAIVKALKKHGYEATHREFDKYQGVELKVKKNGKLIDSIWTVDGYAKGKWENQPQIKKAVLIDDDGSESSANRGDYFMQKPSYVFKGCTLVLTMKDGSKKEIKNPKVSDLPDLKDVGHGDFKHSGVEVLIMQGEKDPEQQSHVEIENGKANVDELVIYLQSIEGGGPKGGGKKLKGEDKEVPLHSTFKPDTYYVAFVKLPKEAQDRLNHTHAEVEKSRYTVYEYHAFVRNEIVVNGARWNAEISLGSVDIQHSDYKYDAEQQEYVDDQGRVIDAEKYAADMADELLAITALENYDVYLTHIEDLDESNDDRFKGFVKCESGEKFKALTKKLAAKGAKDPKALASWIGRKKLGKEAFQKKALAGKKHESISEETEVVQQKEFEGGFSVNMIVNGKQIHAEMKPSGWVWLLLAGNEKMPVYGKSWEEKTLAPHEVRKDIEAFKNWVEDKAKDLIKQGKADDKNFLNRGPKHEDARGGYLNKLLKAHVELMHDGLVGDFAPYSGRSMYGKECVSFSAKDAAASHDVKDMLGKKGIGYRVDALGKGAVFYFPQISMDMLSSGAGVVEDAQSGTVFSKDNKFFVKNAKTGGYYELHDQSKGHTLQGSMIDFEVGSDSKAQLKEAKSKKQKWIILDWAGNDSFHGKTFKSFDDADDFLTMWIEKKYPKTKNDEDAFVEERGEFQIVEKPVEESVMGEAKRKSDKKTQYQLCYDELERLTIGRESDDDTLKAADEDFDKFLSGKLSRDRIRYWARQRLAFLQMDDEQIEESVMGEAELEASKIKAAVDTIGELITASDLSEEDKKVAESQLTIILKVVEAHEESEDKGYLNAEVIKVCTEQLEEVVKKGGKELMSQVDEKLDKIVEAIAAHEALMKDMKKSGKKAKKEKEPSADVTPDSEEDLETKEAEIEGPKEEPEAESIAESTKKIVVTKGKVDL